MRISFYGATREVTGSCYLVETKRARVLVDCGMFQGSKFVEAKNFQPFGFDASTIDAVIVTHAHLDHVGRLPKLIKEGFKGRIYCTRPTAELAGLVLDDALHIMQDDFRREYRPMLFEAADIERMMKQFAPMEYETRVSLDDLTFRFRDAGHIFGSAFVECSEQGGARASFSGDLGNVNVPILRQTEPLSESDILVMESTYGNRIHEDESTREEKLKNVITKTCAQRGALVIPAFAIERTQQLLYELHDLKERGVIGALDVYLDSPMAIKATEIIERYPQYYDEEALKLVTVGDNFFQFPGLHLTPSRDDSKTINEAPKPKMIIAGAGMMNGGRILHHLLRYLGDSASTVLIIGYQAQGTLGHRLYRGDKNVEVLGERIQVKAAVAGIGAYSAHGDQNTLVDWVNRAAKKPAHVYCTHGDEGASIALATRLKEDVHVPCDVPRMGETVVV